MAVPELPEDRRPAPPQRPMVREQGGQRRQAPAPPVNGSPPHGGGPPPPRRPGPPPQGPPPRGFPPQGPPRQGPPPGPTRRPEPVADELTGTQGTADAADPADPADAPGRHRRRAGASRKGRPAAEYREQAEETSARKARPGRRRRTNFWKELPLLVVVALVLTFVIQTFLAKVYVIPSGSMERTLHGCTGCANDRVLVDKITYRFTDPSPGDVVVFRGPESWGSEIVIEEPSNPVVRGLQLFGSLVGIAPPNEKDFVKRIIAVGGQTVQCCDARGQVMVDGESLNEPYIFYLPAAGPPKQAPFGPVTVPEGHLWMMGDSRNNSADSRVPDHGAVPVDNVIGLARFVVLPVDRFGVIDLTDPQSSAVGMADPPVDAPFALGLLGALPLAAAQRRRMYRDPTRPEFLPGRSRRP